MAITIERLLAWDLDGLRVNGRAIRADADTVRALATSLADPARRWRGRAALAAADTDARLREELTRLGDSLMLAGATLAAAAAALELVQGSAMRARDYAAQHSLTVYPDGRVVVPPILTNPNPAPDSPALLRYSEQLRVAEHASALARAALDAAEEADAEAAVAIADAGAQSRRLSFLTEFGMPASWLGAMERVLRMTTAATVISQLSRRNLPDAGAPVADVAAWWSTLSADERKRLVAAFPDHLGGLEGIPAAARHAANSAVLHRELQVARLAVENAGPTWVAGYSFNSGSANRLAMLEAVRRQLAADPSRRLLVLDPRGAGLAAVAVGDVDTADHVAVLVPGLEQDVKEDLDNVVWNAERLQRTADAWTGRIAPGEKVAAVAWLGYRTPTVLTVASPIKALRGAPKLDGFVRGVDASREAARVFDGGRPGAHLTVVGHSYGSLTAGLSVRRATPVDDLVFIGSPGVGSWSTSALSVPAGHVYVGKAARDTVTYTEWFGPDPATCGFGTSRFQTDGGLDSLTGQELTGSHGHSEYFEMHSESVRNIALIAIDRPQEVTRARCVW